MKVEVHSAADFLMNMLRVKQAHSSLPEHQLQHFNRSLQALLVLHFRQHWYPDLPTRGSGYRCIRINGKMDPLVEQAGVAVGLPPPTLRKMLPAELTLWIDPEEVAYRIGENGSICVLYDSSSRTSPASELGAGDSGDGGEEFVMERVGNKMLASSQAISGAEEHLHQMRSGSGYAQDGIRTPSPPRGGGLTAASNGTPASMVSSTSSSMSMRSPPRLPSSPPMSPQQLQQQQQQQQQHHHQQQQYQHHGMHGARHFGAVNRQPQQQHMFADRSAMYQWTSTGNGSGGELVGDGSYGAHVMAAGKVRSQC